MPATVEEVLAIVKEEGPVTKTLPPYTRREVVDAALDCLRKEFPRSQWGVVHRSGRYKITRLK